MSTDNLYRVIKPYDSNLLHQSKSLIGGASKCYKELKKVSPRASNFSIMHMKTNEIYDFNINNMNQTGGAAGDEMGGTNASLSDLETLKNQMSSIEKRIIAIENKLNITNVDDNMNQNTNMADNMNNVSPNQMVEHNQQNQQFNQSPNQQNQQNQQFNQSPKPDSLMPQNIPQPSMPQPSMGMPQNMLQPSMGMQQNMPQQPMQSNLGMGMGMGMMNRQNMGMNRPGMGPGMGSSMPQQPMGMRPGMGMGMANRPGQKQPFMGGFEKENQNAKASAFYSAARDML
jgi:hypothetical protein